MTQTKLNLKKFNHDIRNPLYIAKTLLSTHLEMLTETSEPRDETSARTEMILKKSIDEIDRIFGILGNGRKAAVFILAVWSFQISPLWAEGAVLPQNRVSYWSSQGTNLVPQRQIIPFLEREQLFELIRNRQVVFLDIREPDEFDQSHLPNAVNLPFSKLDEFIASLKIDPRTTYVPYCNWDFRGYVAARKLKEQGLTNLAMMYPHGLRGWVASQLPVAGDESKLSDRNAWKGLIAKLGTVSNFNKSVIARQVSEDSRSNLKVPRQISLRIFPKYTEPDHITAFIGDRLVIELIAEGEDHWFVMPDFGVEEHLQKGERRTVEITIPRSGYFPFGCIHCCTRYRCKTKQAILVDIKEPLSAYGEN